MSAVQQLMLGGGLNGKTLMQVLTDATLTTNLKLCLDAGDAASYDPGVQTDKWLDRSGGGYDFFRGSGTGGDAADPTFTGSASSLQSYWAFDGGDFFTYDTTSETWMQSLHKNAAIYTFLFFFRMPSSATFNDTLFDTTAGTTGITAYLNLDQLKFGVLNAASVALQKTGDTALVSSTWNMVGISVNENGGAAAGFLYLNGEYDQVGGADTWNPNYTSPAAGNATRASMNLCGDSGVGYLGSGARLAALAIWQGTALTKANMDTIWAAMRGRFGI